MDIPGVVWRVRPKERQSGEFGVSYTVPETVKLIISCTQWDSLLVAESVASTEPSTFV